MKPLVNDKLFRAELERLEREGADATPMVEIETDGVFPPASGQRLRMRELMSQREVDRLRAVVRKAGFELINDGASYRAKRGSSFEIWTLETSPLQPEEYGGGESNALWEIVSRFNLKS